MSKGLVDVQRLTRLSEKIVGYMEEFPDDAAIKSAALNLAASAYAQKVAAETAIVTLTKLLNSEY